MEPTESLYCSKCKKIAKKIVAVVATEMEMIWSEMDQCYEIFQYNYQFEETKSVVCVGCGSSTLEIEESTVEGENITTDIP